MNKIFTPRFTFIAIMVILGGLTRLIPAMFGNGTDPYIYNLTAIGAMAIFGGSMMKNKGLGIALPLAAMWISDLVLCNTVYSKYYDVFVWISPSALWVWPSIAIMAIIGMVLIKKLNVKNVVAAALAGPVAFFLITNFGAWIGNSMYPQNFAGLLESYALGLPFLRNDLIGTFLYSGVLFGSFYTAQLKFPVLAKVQ